MVPFISVRMPTILRDPTNISLGHLMPASESPNSRNAFTKATPAIKVHFDASIGKNLGLNIKLNQIPFP